MIRFAWRQIRLQAAMGCGVLVVIAVLAVVTRPQLVHLYKLHEKDALLAQYRWLQDLNGRVLLVAPALIGMFWGAPLIARELETGTFRLAWTQSVTRSRWLATKVALVGIAGLVVTAALSLVVTWWFSPIDAVSMDRFSPGVFAVRGLVPVAYAVFAFALGVALGCALRRTVPAMAATLAVFVAARVAVTIWARPHLLAPVHTVVRLTTVGLRSLLTTTAGGPTTVYLNLDRAGDWIISSGGQIVDASGKVVYGLAKQLGAGSPEALRAALARLDLRAPVVYQPASRYWTFQTTEASIFVCLSLILLALCFWWVRRRVS